MKGEFDLPTITYTPYAIFSNRIPLFDINFFNPMESVDENGLNSGDVHKLGEGPTENFNSANAVILLREFINDSSATITIDGQELNLEQLEQKLNSEFSNLSVGERYVCSLDSNIFFEKRANNNHVASFFGYDMTTYRPAWWIAPFVFMYNLEFYKALGDLPVFGEIGFRNHYETMVNNMGDAFNSIKQEYMKKQAILQAVNGAAAGAGMNLNAVGTDDFARRTTNRDIFSGNIISVCLLS